MFRRWVALMVAVGVLVPLLEVDRGSAEPTPPAPAAIPGDAMAHLDEILARSQPPEYRRFGSPGMQAASDDAAAALGRAGYAVLREDLPGTVYRPDYRPGAAPSLVRVGDGHAFKVDTAFRLEKVTPPQGITCTVRAVADVRRGDCGFVPFLKVSPEWKNTFFVDVLGQVDAIAARGGIGVVLQGDVARNAVIAVSVRRAIPAIVAVATEQDVVGQRVRLRVRGGNQAATLHDVIAVRPPKDPRLGYVLLQGHLDGWFAAAADNGSGAAAVLAAAERLAGDTGGRGLLVALYDGEEWGLLGSQGFAKDLADRDGVRVGPCGPTVRLQDVVAVVNLDEPSAIASDAVGVVQELTGSPESLVSYRAFVFSEEPTLAAKFVQAMTTAGVLGLPLPVSIVNPLLGGGMDRTDGKWFHAAGIPVAWPAAEFPEYHTSADVRDRVDPADLRRVVQGVVTLIRSLDHASITRISGSLPPPGTGPQAVATCIGAGRGTIGRLQGSATWTSVPRSF
jgi:hypothetical protein